MRERLGAFLQMLMAQLRQLYREPEFLFWAFAFPIVLSVGLGIAFREKPPDPVLVGVLQRPGAEGLYLQLSAAKELRLEWVDSESGRRALRRGRLSILAEAPAASGRPAVLRLDPTRPDAALARLEVVDALQRAAGRRDPVEIHVEAMAEPGGRYIDFLIPGLLGMNMMNGGLWGLGFVLVDMRIRKLMKRLVATPMRRSDFLLATLTGRFTVVLLEVAALLAIGYGLFGLRVSGSYGAVAAVSALGSFTFASLGLLVGSRARKIETAAGLVNLVTMPMLLVSGVFFSYERFPEAIRPLIRSLPLTALNDALRAVINEGADLASQAHNLGILAVWALISFLLAVWRFRWT
jgi:ABC-type multidrug transport system permease subunit